MKSIAFLFLTAVSIPFLILFALGLVQLIPTIVSLVFSIIVFLVIANYNAIEIRYKNAVLKTFKDRVNKIKKDTLIELEGEVGLLRYDLDKHIEKTKSDIEDAMSEAIDTAVDEASRIPAKWG